MVNGHLSAPYIPSDKEADKKVRIIIKGGVWRNTEDEILKAAISKYGKNQWARISSLLVRKTPKQCKARWYEWLDPSIKKVEWSKTEDEKLLHLAKLMPTQWRTIAPIVGRTATQCLERYQKLLDDAEQADDQELGLGAGDDPESKEAEGVRSLRAGEIDTDPETRAARPDPVDMDDDEKEMLSEARARLANTQGKKAKRKARERQLEEAKRLAFLQKKRELKAAGINLREKKKKKGMDYNADIPLEHRPAPGFYDTTEEAAKTFSAPIGQSLRALEGKRKQEIEEQEEKNKRRKGGDDKPKNQAAQFVAAREAQIKKLKEQEQVIRRRKLNLPLPQVGERELEDIVKIGQAGEQARELVGADQEGATGRLLGEYEGLGQAKMARTPRTSAPAQDSIMNEARNLRAMASAQTPLLGEENTPMRAPETGTGYDGATPRHEVAATPNPLATPRGGVDGMTPRSVVGGTPMRTPFRDSLSINDATPSMYGQTPADDKRRMRDTQRSLKAGFAALPKPENNFELAEEDEEEDEEGEGQVLTEEDAAERDARLKAAREEEERRELERRSTVVKLGLPRPVNIREASLFRSIEEATPELDGIEAAVMMMINTEMAALMKHDSVAHPLPGSAAPAGGASEYDMPDDDYVALAKSAIHGELASSMGLPGASADQLRLAISASVDPDSESFTHSWAAASSSYISHPSLGTVSPSELTADERDAAYRHMISTSRERMIASATTAAKAEKKLAKQFGGYMALNAKAKSGCAETIEKMHQAKRDLETFGMLRSMEEAGAPARVESKRQEVSRLERREGDLQARYAELLDERRELQREVEQLEEDKVVLEAQAALDAQEDAAEADGDDTPADGDVTMDGQ